MSDNGILSGLTKVVAEVGKVPIKSVHIVIREARGLHFMFGGEQRAGIQARRGRLKLWKSCHDAVDRPRLPPAAARLLAAWALAACETTGLGTATEAAKPVEPPMTHTRAAEQCWMSTEKGSAGMSLDKRADLVDKCIDAEDEGGLRHRRAGARARGEKAGPAEAKKKKPDAAADEPRKRRPAKKAARRERQKTRSRTPRRPTRSPDAAAGQAAPPLAGRLRPYHHPYSQAA